MKNTSKNENYVNTVMIKSTNSNRVLKRYSLFALAMALSASFTVFSMQLSYAGSTIVTDAVGTDVLWTFEENLGVQNLTSKVNQVDGKSITQTWDANNNMVSRTDEEGRVTSYTYNASNQKTSMTEASGAPQARTTTYDYVSADIDLVTRTTIPSVLNGSFKETTNVYDADLNITSTTVTGFSVTGLPVTRSTLFSYNDRGQVTQIDGPRTDVNDLTTFNYYNCNTGAECGQLQSVTNALGHTTTYDSYDANARLLQSTDANGIVTTNTYHPRGWLLTRTQTAPDGEARTTTYGYDNVGQMVQTISPDGIVLTYEYDAAHDLRAITDNVGNRVEYTYDSRGNRHTERTLDVSGILAREVQTVYDIRNFVASINAGGSVTQMVNDAVGNLSQQTDPNENPETNHGYDALDRLNTTLDALANSTNYTYNVADQLIQVTAPNGAATSYDYDDLGNLLKEVSSDRGTMIYTHDDAGNVISQTDARGITVNYQYDALNRLTNVSFPDASENSQYSYDTCPILGVGRLCATQHTAGSEAIAYDSWGNVTTVLREESGLALETVSTAPSFTTRYAYDTGNRLIKTTYPSGRTVDYTRDEIGRVISVTSRSADGILTPIITNRDYRADGLWLTQDYGNGTTQTKDYDTQGRLMSHTSNGDYTRTYDYDPNGNIIDIQGSLNALYGYDPLNRLISDTVTDLGIDLTFDYDANGNRIEATDAGNTTVLTYEQNSNRSTTIGSANHSLDASGRTLTDTQGRDYRYNDAGRLEALSQNGNILGEYQYNAHQLRALKRVNDEYTVYHYDLAGNMLAESDLAGNFVQEYGYVDGERVALFVNNPVTTTLPEPPDDYPSSTNTGNVEIAKKVLPIIMMYLLIDDDQSAEGGDGTEDGSDEPSSVHFYINDHLSTPQRLVDEAGEITWEANYEAFGQATITTEDVTQNHRFTGQYYDAESGLYYNWNRYYDAEVGRYVTSDPIGLGGGLNTFGYVGGNPLVYSDLRGLARGPFGGVCGPAGTNLATWIPDGRFTPACKNHDNCYDCSGIPRYDCDNSFCRELVNSCYGLSSCVVAAGIYCIFVKLKGGAFYTPIGDPTCKTCRP